MTRSSIVRLLSAGLVPVLALGLWMVVIKIVGNDPFAVAGLTPSGGTVFAGFVCLVVGAVGFARLIEWRPRSVKVLALAAGVTASLMVAIHLRVSDQVAELFGT